MGSGGAAASTCSSSQDVPASISELREKQQLDLENLTLTTQPYRTIQCFFCAIFQYLNQSLLYILTNGGWFMCLSIFVVAFGMCVITVVGTCEKRIQEFVSYSRYVLWWVALGVASSIGLGSGLHTFVLYLGPHIALFTIKAMSCGRVDLKSAPYDTIQLKRGPSWLDKDCAEFGPSLYPSTPHSLVRVPLTSILPQVQLEAILWGLGTALGELPPYFIARAARLSGSKLDSMEGFDADSLKEDGPVSAFLKNVKYWLLSHSQHLNFFTILLLASVPNPLFDLAGIMCGQFGIPFWKFFFATVMGKAIFKTHLQTIFIICVCNNQLLEWVENEFLWVLGHFPGFSSMLPNIIAKLHTLKGKYLSPVPAPTLSVEKANQWTLSFSLVWNTVVWLVLMNFFVKIVTAAAQRYLKQQQDLELTNKLLVSKQAQNESDG